MSLPESLGLPVIEWSPTHVVAYDPATERRYEGATIADIASQLGSRGEVIVGLSRRSSFFRTARLPNAPKAEVAKVLALQLGTLFPVASTDLATDFILTEDVTSEGRQAVVAAIRTDILDQLQRELKASGLKAKRIVPVAFGSLILARQRELTRCAVVSHTSEGLSIDLISEDELVYTRVVPFPRDATDLDAEICRTFTIARMPSAEVVAAGGLVFEEADIRTEHQVAQYLGTAGLERLDLVLESPEAISERESRIVRSRARFSLMLLLAAIVVTGIVYFDNQDALARVQREREGPLRDRKILTQRKNELKSTISGASGKLEDLQRAFSPAQLPSDVFAVISDAVPRGAWLTGVTFERGKQLQVRGTATDSSALTGYLQRLNTEKRFRDVRLVFENASKIDEVPVVQFSISMHVVGNYPLEDIDAKGGRR